MSPGRLRGGSVGGRPVDESGFSLVETVIAITIAALMLTALGGVLTTSMMTGLFARQSQNAIDLASETLESYRALGYQALAMDPNKVASSDPKLGGTSANPTFDPGNGSGPEPLVRLNNGAVDHQQAVTKGLTPYTVWSYVTLPVDAQGATYKRVTVRVTWTKNNALHERRATSYVSLVRRGLPLPNFVFGDPVERTYGQGTKVVLPVTIVNRGARDVWNLTATATRPAWIIRWYADRNADRLHDAGDTLLTNTDGDPDGKVDTGLPLVETDQSVPLLAVTVLPAFDPVTATGSPVHVTLTAVSSAQPGTEGTRTIVDKVHITDGCELCTYRSFFLHNSVDPLITDTPAQADMPADTASPTATTLYDYDTSSPPSQGRSIAAGGAGAEETDLALTANWDFVLPEAMELKGGTLASPARVRLYATTTDAASSSPGSITVYIRHRSVDSTSFTTIASSSPVAVASGPTLEPLDIDIALGADNIALVQNDVIELKVVSSGGAVWLGYDTTTYPAQFRLPVV